MTSAKTNSVSRLPSLGRALVGVTMVAHLSCSGADGQTPSTGDLVGDFSRSAMLASLGRDVILPTYRQVEAEAEALEAHAMAYVAAVEVDAADTATRAADLKAAFHRTMSAWQRAEVMQIGPAASSLGEAGGQDLRDEIYSWPTVNPCRVDQVLVEEGYAAARFFDEALVNVYGLDALEYLLFDDDLDNACPPQLEINQGAWDALDPQDITVRRARYAARVAGHLRATAEALVMAWDPAAGNFLGALSAPQSEASPFRGPREAVDALFHAMYYVELEVKDMKLALPAGVSARCPAETCPEDLESRFARRSLENIAANLRGFRALLRGQLEDAPDGLGFDDFLAAAGAADLATAMDARAVAAIERAEGMQADLRTLLADDPDAARALHSDVKALTDLLKSQFVTVLALSVPQEGAADND